MNQIFSFSSFIVLSLLFSTHLAFADTPVIRSFSASSQNVTSGGPLGFSWAIDNGPGPNFTISCPLGVRLTRLDGSAFSCNTTSAPSADSFFAVDLLAYNTSGSTRTLVATLVPKDATGTTYPALSKSVSVNIQTDPNPIFSFTSSASTTDKVESFTPIVLSWTARPTTKVNIQIDCNNQVLATSSSYLSGQNFVCDRPIFSTDLATPGSLTLSLYNKGQSNTDVKFKILPVIDTGSYDGTHSQNLVITVAPYKPSVPRVDIFTLPPRVTNGATTTMSWSVVNAAGVNIQSSCQDYIQILAAVSSTTKKVQCGGYIFSDYQLATGTVAISFTSFSSVISPVTLFIVPRQSDGTYNATLGKRLSIFIDPFGSSTIYPPVANPPVSLPNIPLVPGGTPIIKATLFTRALSSGLRGAEVTTLQTFLKKDKTIYPEGLVTGYFGPATTRAVKRFQEKYGIASSGVAGYGLVGPKTRAKLNELQ